MARIEEKALRIIHKNIDVKIEDAIHELRDFILGNELKKIDIFWEEVITKLRSQARELENLADLIERCCFNEVQA